MLRHLTPKHMLCPWILHNKDIAQDSHSHTRQDSTGTYCSTLQTLLQPQFTITSVQFSCSAHCCIAVESAACMYKYQQSPGWCRRLPVTSSRLRQTPSPWQTPVRRCWQWQALCEVIVQLMRHMPATTTMMTWGRPETVRASVRHRPAACTAPRSHACCHSPPPPRRSSMAPTHRHTPSDSSGVHNAFQAKTKAEALSHETEASACWSKVRLRHFSQQSKEAAPHKSCTITWLKQIKPYNTRIR